MGDPEEFVAFVEDAEIPANHLAPMLERMPSLESTAVSRGSAVNWLGSRRSIRCEGGRSVPLFSSRLDCVDETPGKARAVEAHADLGVGNGAGAAIGDQLATGDRARNFHVH